MGALNFLELPPLPDALRPDTYHSLELYETGGELFIKVIAAAPTGNDQAYCADQTPYTASIYASMRVTPAQLKIIEESMVALRQRIGA